MKILLKTIRQEKYFLNTYLLIFSYIWGAFVIVKQKYRKRMEIRGNEELEREQKLEKREYERVKKSWEEIGKDKEGPIKRERLCTFGGSCFSTLCWAKCVVLAKIHPWLSRKVFVSVAGRGFVVWCGRGLKKQPLLSLCVYGSLLNIGCKNPKKRNL